MRAMNLRVSSERADRIQALVTRLEEPNVLWDEVEDHLAGFPGWLQLVRTWRYPQSTSNTRMVHFGAPVQYVVMHQDRRLRLLDFLRPYALLLNEAQEPAGRAIALQRAGVDVPTFCKEHSRNPVPEIAAAARAVLDACTADKTLLRAAAPAVAPDELLHLASPIDTPADELLRPNGTPSPDAPGVGSNWLRRRFCRRDSR